MKSTTNKINSIFYLLKIIYIMDKRLIFTMIIKIILRSIVPFVMIFFPKYIIDSIIAGENLPKVIYLTIIMTLVSFVLQMISSYINKYENVAQSRITYQLVDEINKKSIKIDYSRYLETETQIKMANACRLPDNGSCTSILNSFTSVTSNIITMIGIFALVIRIDVILLISSIVVVIAQGYTTFKNAKIDLKMQNEMLPQQRLIPYLSSLLCQPKYRKDLIIFKNGFKYILKKVNDCYNIVLSSIDVRQKHELNKSMINNGFSSIFQIMNYILLGIKAFRNTISIGDFTMFMNALNQFVGCCNGIVWSVIDLNRCTEYINMYSEYMQIPSVFGTGAKLISNSDKEKLVIQFENVSFKYPGSDFYVLKNINITIDTNEKLALVGENGAGKTTFIKLVCRLYDPTEGRILLNGIDIKEIDYNEYTNLFSAVFQDFMLYMISILDNITHSIATTDEEYDKVRKLIYDNGLSERINGMKNGINTALTKNFDPEGEDLSGGEAQRIAIIRALYKDSPIIILDEPTAALDPKAEYDIYINFSQLTLNKIAIYISHRLASNKFCDKVAMFDHGKIIEYGTPNDLLALKGEYYQMYTMQSELYMKTN